MPSKRPPHAMIDLETAGQSVKSAVWSIGIVLFDPWGETPVEPRQPYQTDKDLGHFYLNLKTADQIRRGMVYEEGTIRWWMKQPDEARFALESPAPVDVPFALKEMESFIKANSVKYVWSNGVDFDIAILNLLWLNFFGPDVKMPWFFSNTEHTRTTWREAFQDGRPPSMKIETAHHALVDAYRQACGVQEAKQQMRTYGIIWPDAPVAAPLLGD